MYIAQVPIQPVAIDRQCRVWIGRDRLQFRTEHECAVEATVVERLYAEPISHQAQCSLADIPEREREHAVERLERPVEAPGFDGRKDHLGVRVTAPAWRQTFQLERASDRRGVVDLTVVRDHVPTRCGVHGLMALG